MSPALTPKKVTPAPKVLKRKRVPNPKIAPITQPKRQIWWDGSYDGYWRVLLGPINWANPEVAAPWPTEEGALKAAANNALRDKRWAKVFDPNGKLIASFDRKGNRNDRTPLPLKKR